MKPLQVTLQEMDLAKEIEEQWEELLARAQSGHVEVMADRGFKEIVIGFVHEKHFFWNYMKRKYNLDPYLNYRINVNGYLEVERGRELWHLWERS